MDRAQNTKYIPNFCGICFFLSEVEWFDFIADLYKKIAKVLKDLDAMYIENNNVGIEIDINPVRI